MHPNQAENGAWLPGPKLKHADPPPVGTPHRPIHTDAYYDDVARRLSEANSKEKALEILKDLGQQVERGDYP